MGYLSSIFLRFFLRQVLLSKENLSPKFRGNQNKSKKSLLIARAPYLCSVSSSTCQPKPPALLVVCSMLAIVFLVCRFRGLVDCCIGALLASWSTLPQLCTLILRQGLVAGSNITTSAVQNWSNTMSSRMTTTGNWQRMACYDQN